MFDATAEFVCVNPECDFHDLEPVTVPLREVTKGVWELPRPRCQSNLSLEMRLVSIAGSPV